MSGIAPGRDDREVHTLRLDGIKRVLNQGGTDALALVLRMHGDHVDLAGPGRVLVDDADGDEAHGAVVDDGDPDVVLWRRADTFDGGRLARAPVRVDRVEDLRTQLRTEAGEHRLPRVDRELDNGIHVGFGERADRLHGLTVWQIVATMTSIDQLGAVLMVWAHPDDETYLAGAVSALLTDAGHRVVCITATRGEAGGDGQVRTVELEQALGVLGVSEHHWLDFPDGGCADVDPDDPVARIRSIADEVRPDTVLTFGPDGITGHPDHQAVSAWVDLAISGREVRLLHAVEREERVDRELDEEFGVYELGPPRMLPDDEIDLLLRPEGVLLDRKISALLLQKSQTGGLVDAVGLERFRAWAADEAFAAPAEA